MIWSIDYISLLWGIGLFMYGMSLFEDAIHRASWKKLKALIQKWTGSWIKSIFAGTIVTTILQSSTLVSFIILWFVGAGMMTLSNGIAAIIGANVGTVLSNRAIVLFGFKLDMNLITLPIIALGSIGVVVLKDTNKFRNTALFLLWFGLLLLGLEYMKISSTWFTDTIDFSKYVGLPMIVFILIGIIGTIIIRSSSAVVAIILAAMATGHLDINTAVGLILGANVGTTATAIMAALRGKTIQKQIAASHFFYNMIIVILGGLLYKYILNLVRWIMGWKDGDPVVAISLFNTIFNVAWAVLFAPLIGIFTRFIEKVVPDRTKVHRLSREELLIDAPEEASISALKTDSIYLLTKVFEFNMRILGIEEGVYNNNLSTSISKKKPKFSPLRDQYIYIKNIEEKIYRYIINLDQSKFNKEESEEIWDLHRWISNAVYAAKFLKDIANNTQEISQISQPAIRSYLANNQQTLIDMYRLLSSLTQDSVSDEELKSLLEIISEHEKSDEYFKKKKKKVEIASALGEFELSSLLHTHRYICLSIQHIITTINYMLLEPRQRVLTHKYNDYIF